MEVIHIANLFCAETGKFDFFIRKKAKLKQIGNFLQLFGDGRRVAKKPHFSPIPLLWTSFPLISMVKRMAKNEFCIKQRHSFPTNSVIKQLFCFSRMRTTQNFDFLFANLYWSFPIAVFFSLPFFYISSFFAHFIVFFCIELWLANF